MNIEYVRRCMRMSCLRQKHRRLGLLTMTNDKFECTFKGGYNWLRCVTKTPTGFDVCKCIRISSDVKDEKRG